MTRETKLSQYAAPITDDDCGGGPFDVAVARVIGFEVIFCSAATAELTNGNVLWSADYGDVIAVAKTIRLQGKLDILHGEAMELDVALGDERTGVESRAGETNALRERRRN
ncbi:MAG: hypothetical protein ACT4QE_24455 [Anaerolineales bacterium]